MIASAAHTERIKDELKQAGLSSVALHRFSSRYLANVIHEDEHIEGAVCGRHKESEAWFGQAEGMLVATDKRVIYLDRRPGFTTMDEVTYDVVGGVNLSVSAFSASLTLYTRVANYTVSHASIKAANHFADCIEKRRLDAKKPEEEIPLQPTVPPVDRATFDFLQSHETAVLSTIDRTGNVRGAVVYFMYENSFFYLLTKQGTRKARSMMAGQQVSLTIYDADMLQLVQVWGVAEVENDPVIKEYIYENIVKPRKYKSGTKLPPVTQVHTGGFIVFRIKPVGIEFSDFN